MKKFLFSFLLFTLSTASFSAKWQIVNDGFTFLPATVTIAFGDSVNFSLDPTHDALEVSQATWNANGSTPLPGGFHVPFGGGLLIPAQLPVGTHYYVCSNHVSGGMKGIIIVQNNSGISNNQLPSDLSVCPNPAGNSITLKAANALVGSQYLITDQGGRRIMTGKLVDITTPVDISQLAPGVYMIQVVGQKRLSVKVIKN